MYIIAHVADDLGEATVRGALEAGEPCKLECSFLRLTVLSSSAKWISKAFPALFTCLLLHDMSSITCFAAL